MAITPDIAIVGASRAGSTNLASRLSGHPRVQLPAVKEPNYFSVNYARGQQWYDSLFREPTSDSTIIDASTSYSYPNHPEALDRLTSAAPGALYVYLVREPVTRAFSQFVHEAVYLEGRSSARFLDEVRRDSGALAVSRYGVTLNRLEARIDPTQILVVPFEVLITDPDAVVGQILEHVGLDARETKPPSDASHRNERVRMRSAMVRAAFNQLRDTRAYPRLRSLVGDRAVRRIRRALTSRDGLPSLADALADLDSDGAEELAFVFNESREAVRAWLLRQDARLGTSWAPVCSWLEAAKWNELDR